MDLIVGVGDMKVSNDPDMVLATFSMGSCVGICVWDPIARVAGLLHYMLPLSSIDRKKAEQKPYMFGDTGIPALFKASYTLGASKKRMRVVMVGGSQIFDNTGIFNIGMRNIRVARELFRRNNVSVDFEDVGGTVNRTLKIAVSTGEVRLKVSGQGTKKISWT